MPAFLQLPDGSSILVQDGLIIGRDPRAGLVVKDTKASRKHARLISAGGVVEIEDLDSSNGTLLNGKPVDRRMLREGDEIRIGKTVIRFVEGVEISPASPADFEPGGDLFGDEPAEPAAPPAPHSPEPHPRQHQPQEVVPGGDLFEDASADELDFVEEAPPARPASPPVREPAASEPAAREPAAREPAASSSPPREAFDPQVEVRKPDADPASAVEEVLEFADDDVVVVRRAAPAPEPVAKAGPAKRPGADRSATEARDGGVLQFRKVEDKGGLAMQDLGQMSGGMRLLLVLVALAVAAGLFYGAMQLAG